MRLILEVLRYGMCLTIHVQINYLGLYKVILLCPRWIAFRFDSIVKAASDLGTCYIIIGPVIRFVQTYDAGFLSDSADNNDDELSGQRISHLFSQSLRQVLIGVFQHPNWL